MKLGLVPSPPPLINPANGLANFSVDAAIQRHVAEVLAYTEGDHGWAASELGVDASTLYRWLRGWASGRQMRPQLNRRMA